MVISHYFQYLQSLNGWRRLWLVLGALYLFPVIAIATIKMPHGLSIKELLGSDSVIGGDREPYGKQEFVLVNGSWIEVEATASNPITKEHIYKLDGKWSEPSKTLEQAAFPRSLTGPEQSLLLEHQAKFWVIASLWWLLPWLAIYVAGAVAAWVFDGFKNHTTQR